MPSFLDSLVTSVSSGLATAQTTFTNFVDDTRNTNTQRPRASSIDPTVSIDKTDSTQILNFPSDRPKYYITFAFEDYRRPTQFEGLSSNGLTDYICLPMPSTLRDNNNLNWSADDGNFLIESIAKGIGDYHDANKTAGVNALLQQIGNDASSALSGGALQNARGLAQNAENVLGNIPGLSSSLTNGLAVGALQLAGLADNPFSTVAFHGPNFKEHMFHWRLAPKTPDESATIHQICETFKKAAYPGLLTSALGGFYKYPMIVWPKFQPDAAMNSLYLFKPCVIASVNIDKAPNDRPGFYADTNAPLEVILELHLKEIELWRNGDGQNGTISGGDFSSTPSPPTNMGQI